MAVTFDWYSFKQSQKAVEHGVVHGGNSPFPPPSPPPPQHLPSTRVPLLFVSERICTSKNPLAFVACSDNKKKKNLLRSLHFYYIHNRRILSRECYSNFPKSISLQNVIQFHRRDPRHFDIDTCVESYPTFFPTDLLRARYAERKRRSGARCFVRF